MFKVIIVPCQFHMWSRLHLHKPITSNGDTGSAGSVLKHPSHNSAVTNQQPERENIVPGQNLIQLITSEKRKVFFTQTTGALIRVKGMAISSDTRALTKMSTAQLVSPYLFEQSSPVYWNSSSEQLHLKRKAETWRSAEKAMGDRHKTTIRGQVVQQLQNSVSFV